MIGALLVTIASALPGSDGAALVHRHVAAFVHSAVADRMRYWKNANEQTQPFVDPESDRYLFFEYDIGGLNNIRIGWEMAAVAAVASNRTLVYPAETHMYLIDAESASFEYFVNMDLVHSGMKAMSIKQFISSRRGRLEMPASLLEYAESSEGELPVSDWQIFKNQNMKGSGKNENEVCNLAFYKSDESMVYTDPWEYADGLGRIFGCGNWPNVGEPKFYEDDEFTPWEVPQWAYELLRNNFVWHPDAFEIAGHVVQHLGIFNYVSMHARYGDFQFQTGNAPQQVLLGDHGWLADSPDTPISLRGKKHSNPTSLLSTSADIVASTNHTKAAVGWSRGKRALGVVRTWMKEGHSIYIATDEVSPEYLQPFQEAGLNAVRWQELMDQAKSGAGPLASMLKKYSEARLLNLAGVVEQLICTFGHIFIGSEKSTFTGYIERMRLYAQAPTHATFIEYDGAEASDKGMRMFHDDTASPEVEAALRKQIADWEREGKRQFVDRDDIGELPPLRR